jgi:hypothetical protein
MISQRKLNARAKSREFIKGSREEVLEQCGYSRLKAKHGKSKRPDFPNLKVESRYSTSDVVGNGFKTRSGAQHPDAKNFPVQTPHKQGPMLFTRADDARYAGGKKS